MDKGRYGQRLSRHCVQALGERGRSSGRVRGRYRGHGHAGHDHGCSLGRERGVVGSLLNHSGIKSPGIISPLRIRCTSFP